jgi:hypothetical protein
MSLILYYPTKAIPTATCTLPSPERSNVVEEDYGQVQGRTRGGTTVVYARAARRAEHEYQFIEVSDTVRENLDTLFGATYADGSAKTVQLDDHLGDTYTARLAQDGLTKTNVGEDSATPAKPFWTITLRLEIIT